MPPSSQGISTAVRERRLLLMWGPPVEEQRYELALGPA
jgi:hypothetical protein